MRIKNLENGNIELAHDRILFASKALLDNANALLFVQNRSWLFFVENEVYKYKDVDCLRIDAKDRGSEEDHYWIYILELQDMESNIIWRHETSSNSKFKELSNVIRENLNISSYPQSLGEHSMACKSCKRAISKVSTKCIYCSAKQ